MAEKEKQYEGTGQFILREQALVSGPDVSTPGPRAPVSLVPLG